MLGDYARVSTRDVMIEVYVNGLKSRNEDSRLRFAKELQRFATTELQEMNQDDIASFMETFNKHIFELTSSQDTNDKKGGILAIIILVGVDIPKNPTHCSRFANYLRNQPPTDIELIELTAYAIGKVALASDQWAAQYVEYEVKRAIEWLQSDKNEAKRHSALLILRELATATPNYFFQQVQPFFENIFPMIRSPTPLIRETAISALRAALDVICARESKEPGRQSAFYEACYNEAISGFEEVVQTAKERLARDDRLHGSLLILNELLRCSNVIGEKMRQEVEENTQQVSNELVNMPHRYQMLRDWGVAGLAKSFRGFQAPASLHYVSPGHGLRGLSAVVQHHKKLGIAPGMSSSSKRKANVESPSCKQIVADHFSSICELVMKQKGSKNLYIQHVLMIIIPRLAAFDPNVFAQKYLAETMAYLLRREKDRSQALISIGLLSIAVKDHVSSYLPRILEIVKPCIISREGGLARNRKVTVDQSVFVCLALLAQTTGIKIKNDVKELIEPMIATGLSPGLISALHDISVHIPLLKKDVQENLLKMLSQVLMQRPYRHPGAPKPVANTPTTPMEAADTNTIILALKVLGKFDFQSRSLMQFVKYCAEHYIAGSAKDVRLEAVRTCCQLLIPALVKLKEHHSPSLVMTVQDILGKLLIVAVTDSDPQVRYSVLAALDERFDEHLAQADNLSALFICLNDELFEIRELALCSIGRLGAYNPAYVMPSLRKVLLQLLTDLEYSGVTRNKEQSARMLAHLISNAPILIRPYTEAIVRTFIPKLTEPEPYPSVIISVLGAVGAQAQVSGIEMKKWMSDLFPLVLDVIQDSSSLPKREVGLWTLGQLVECTGYVVEPYTKYPGLIDILFNFLKSEPSQPIRREAIRVLGLLGAIDPYKYKLNLGQIDGDGESLIAVPDPSLENQDIVASDLLVNMSNSYDDFYPAIAIATLMKMLKDPSFHQPTNIVQVITFIFMHLGARCIPYIPQVTPAFIHVIRSSEPSALEFLFQQLGTLISIVKQHIRNYLDEIFVLIKDFWTPKSPIQGTLIQVVGEIVIALGGEFKVYVPRLIPHILHVFNHDESSRRQTTLKMLQALQHFGTNLDDYLHMILPPIIKLFDSTDIPLQLRKDALQTIDVFSETLELTEFASRIIHPLVRVLDTVPDLRAQAMDTLTAVIAQLGKKYQIFIPMVHKVLIRHRINHQRYDVLVGNIVRGEGSVDEDIGIMSMGRLPRPKTRQTPQSPAMADSSLKKQGSVGLHGACTVVKRTSREDWLDWLRILSIELLKESPSLALRSCFPLAKAHVQLTRDLFNAAFLSCWTEMSDKQQQELMDALRIALKAQDVPELTQTLLNLAEFMEHCDKGPLPLDPKLLATRAIQCRAFAKALHYKEDEFHKGPTTEVLESLISINNKLQHPEAAAGVLVYAMKNSVNNLKVKERWYEKLHEWDNALKAYSQKREANANDTESAMGEMRCLEVLGEWNKLHHLTEDVWPKFSAAQKQKVARMASSAAWGLGEWSSMEEYSKFIKVDSSESSFYKAVLAVHHEKYQLAQRLIDKARDLIDTDLTAMASESYNRAYGAMVQVVMLSELEEVIQYKLVPERREMIKEKWSHRLQGCQRVVEDWQKILQVHSLVLTPMEDMKTWIKYASLCQQAGRHKSSERILRMLTGNDQEDALTAGLPSHPQVAFAYIKHLWKSGQTKDAYRNLHQFVQMMNQAPNLPNYPLDDPQVRAEHGKLLSRCYLKLGQWHENLFQANDQSIPVILKCFEAATEHDKDWYKAWHAWAYMNYEAVLFYKQQQHQHVEQATSTESAIVPPGRPIVRTQNHREFTVPAVQGFFRSITLSNGNSLQDTLRLLTLWFDDGQYAEVYEALVEGIKVVPVETWLQVIPQLIARIDTPRHLVGRLIHQLLVDIGKHHPQALIYPLTVASKAVVPARQQAAHKILNSMREHSSNLVQQAVLVSEELIRVAILWHELWHEGLEEASRLYFGERNVQGMFETLEPLHAMMERGAQTLKEMSFSQMYGRDLMEALEWCKKFQNSANVKDLTQAWDLYYHVFRRISKQLPSLTSLELQYVSPKLLMCRDLELAVPGSYNPSQNVVRIACVEGSLSVITSKQRPRKLTIKGSNGKDYMFLLKGHEDLRQDERVMQLFGLVNTLLVSDPETSRRNLAIQRYAVIPLSTNSGLIGWMPHCDTLHTLIRDYREKKKILLNIEHRIMLRMAPDYDHLPLMQKVEVFEHALEHTQGDDLAKLLWLKSPSSEVWFERRTNYTRSLAVMSMVGYVLGLGDRHPSNLMLDRLSGKIIHIDFGDCFEVAMTREKFPEKIPFRLTRMLINAMEVTGIEGTYRTTCEKVMQVLRNNKDSLMAVLEAFVYDPLLNWRLMDVQPKPKHPTQGRAVAEGVSSDQVTALSSAGQGDEVPKAAATIASSVIGQRGDGAVAAPEALNKKALTVVNRVRDKLTGRDFDPNVTLEVKQQVDMLIRQATSHEHLCQCYIGWCPFW
ncbi:Serine/threonine-protein kinase mTOR [Halotydeus destructor]|nr:Serine/threonine-protein kinase mTOR [Halotydeus destructor]